MKRAIIALILCAAGSAAQAQTTPKVFFACFVQNSGTVYRIRETGLPTACTNVKHTEFSWIDGVPGYDHGALNGLGDDDHPQYLFVDGTRALTGNLKLGGFKIIGLAAATQAGDAVRFEEAVKIADAAGGDLSGSYPNPGVAKLQGQAISSTTPTSGQVLSFDGSAWTPVTPPAGVTDHGALNGLADDDHLQYLLADGVRATTNGFAVTGSVQSGAIPAEGSGTRLMWYPGKAAFRAGTIPGSQWDDANVGFFSAAFGFATIASGRHATAFGGTTRATGFSATALGDVTVASGDFATAMGTYANTNGQAGSFVYGDASTRGSQTFVQATSPNQFVARASGGFRFRTAPDLTTGCDISSGALSCTGMIESASGGFQFPDGSVQTTAATGGASGTPDNIPGTLVQRDAAGRFSAGAVTLFGPLTVTDNATIQGATILAGQARANTDGGFVVGGTRGVGVVPATGPGARIMWYPGKAALRAGEVTSTQWDAANIGSWSVALGLDAIASGDRSIALGHGATASGSISLALGGGLTTASGINSTAIGDGSTASGRNSVAIGHLAIASGDYSTVIGNRASANLMTGSFVYGDASTQPTLGDVVQARFPNSFVVRAQQVWFGKTGDQPDNVAGYLTADGVIASTQGGFKFPDGTVQTTAATGGASGTPNNTPGTLVQRDAAGGFAAGAVTLSGPLTVTTGNATIQGDTFLGGTLTAAGVIGSTDGGFKFPDGTVQTTAATGGAGAVTIRRQLASISPGQLNAAIALSCPVNTKVTSGGFRLASHDASVFGSYPSSTTQFGERWIVEAANPSSGAVDLEVFAVCVS